MILHQQNGPPSPQLALALARFEEQFTYPLGPGRSFRISHGTDYTRFFRSMGEATCFVAIQDGCVLGSLGVAVRRLMTPEGRDCPAAYLGDLKIIPEARGGMVLVRLARAAEAWIRPRAAVAFSVVMDGTRATPDTYTGRVGMPAFARLARTLVWRIPVPRRLPAPNDALHASEAGEDLYRQLSRGRYACPGGVPSERSATTPLWLIDPDGTACGQLEDTRRAKRLLADDGMEMASAHLSYFGFRTSGAGAGLLRAALWHSAQRNLPALCQSPSGIEPL